MKFIRLDKYTPTYSAEVLEGLALYSQIYALRNELHTFTKVAGRTITASMNLLKIRIAKLVESATLTGKDELLLTDLSSKLSEIKQRYPDPDAQKQAISELIFNGKYWEFIMGYLHTNYLPKLERALQRGFNGMPPVDESTAMDIAMTAMQNFVQNKDKASIVSSLERFDASQGSLLTWIEGGVRAATQRLVAEHLKTQNQETSSNQTIGDNDDTEIGDMFADNSQANAFDITNYAERADNLWFTFNKYIDKLESKIETTEIPAEKFKLQTLLNHILDENNNVRVKIEELQTLGKDIEDYTYDTQQSKADIQDFINEASKAKLGPNELAGAQKYIQKLQNQLKNSEVIQQQAIQKFENMYVELANMAQYDADTGATLIDQPNMQEPLSQISTPDNVPNISPEVENSEDTTAPEDIQVRNKPRGRRELLSPQDESLLLERLENSRNQLLPSFYKSMNFPASSKDVYNADGANLFNLKVVKDNVKTKDDLEALISGNLENASNNAIYADIVLRGMLYARDKQAMDKAYDPEIVRSEAETLKRATEQFYHYVTEEIKNNPVLQQRQNEYIAQNGPIPENDIASPQGQLLSNLTEYIKGGTENNAATPDNRFRTFFEYFDHMARGSAYHGAKEKLFPDTPWESLTPENKMEIANSVYEDQYSGGYRPMYIAKHKPDGTNKYEPRYPLQPDISGDNYKMIMNRELDRIGLSRSNPKGYSYPQYQRNDWYEISENPDDFKNRAKVKTQKINDADILASGVINAWIKLANAFDSIGCYAKADEITNNLNKLVHG